MDYFDEFENYISRLPGIKLPIGKGQTEEGFWWVKFSFDLIESDFNLYLLKTPLHPQAERQNIQLLPLSYFRLS